MKLSIITSLKPNEVIETTLKQNILTLAQELRNDFELEWVLISAHEGTLNKNNLPMGIDCTNLIVTKILGGSNRASCMNLGVNQSEGELLWFLHADSSFCGQELAKLFLKMDFDNKISYFDLKFSDGLRAMKINEIGVRFRCRILKTPFGDQGLIMSKGLFQKLGTYDEQAPYGEDHLLIREALRSKIPVEPIGASLVTSPRKYQENGWLKTTVLHQFLWYKQICGWYKKSIGLSFKKEIK